jgi:hypothetical protein
MLDNSLRGYRQLGSVDPDGHDASLVVATVADARALANSDRNVESGMAIMRVGIWPTGRCPPPPHGGLISTPVGAGVLRRERAYWPAIGTERTCVHR